MTKHRQDIDCEEVLKELFTYLDGELNLETKKAFDHHIDGCRSCFSRTEFERRLRQRLGEAVESEVPENLRNRIDKIINNY